MRNAIATVSLGGTLRDKLAAIAEAGFEGLEIFETDILAHDGPPADVGRMARDLGLEIIALQPFRDFEGMPEPRRSRNFERARRKFELMAELGTNRLLVCSNVSPQILGGIDRAAEDLRALGELAAGAGVEIAFEALSWGRWIRDWRDAWEAVRRADHPNVRLVLDSFHTLAPGYPVEPIRAVPADRIAFVQLADAPAIQMDILQLSRHLRLFPGQGDLDVPGFLEAVRATGYDGWISHEIFNDRFRMASTRRIAADGERSLIALTGTARGGRPLPPRTSTEGVAFIEFAVDEEAGADLAALFRAMGFRHAGQHRSKEVARFAQGDVNLLVNTESEGFAHSHFVTHGPSVAAICLVVGDAGAQLDRAEALLAQPYRQAIGTGELSIPAIRGVGGSLLHFIDRRSDLARLWEIDFASIEDDRPDAGLVAVDHLAQSIPFEELPTWRLFYLSIFDFEKAPTVDVVDPGGPRGEPGAPVAGTCGSGHAQRQPVATDPIRPFHGRALRRRGAACRLRDRRHLRRRRAFAVERRGAAADPGELLRRSRGALRPRAGAGRPFARSGHPVRRGRAGAVLPGLHPRLRGPVLLRDRAEGRL
jgi:4-hydroxyphenylpyruvate dioxygenase